MDPVDWFTPAEDPATPIYDQLLAELCESHPTTDDQPPTPGDPRTE